VALVTALCAASSSGWALGQADAGGPPLAEVVATVGGDPLALHAYVAEHVALEPYAGAMRGPEGTVAAGAGNAADQALLLRALIESADASAETRFATCTLAEDEVTRALAALTTAAPERPRTLLEMMDDVADVIDDAELRASALGLAGAWRELVDTVAAHTALLEDLLVANGHVPRLPMLAQAAARDALARHAWLQLRDGDGWLDLDPGATPGAARCPPADTYPDLPDDHQQRVTVEIVVETRDEGTLSRATLLRFERSLLALGGPGIAFVVAETFGEALAPEREPEDDLLAYTPALVVGDATLLGAPFYLPVPESRGAASAGGGALGGLGGVLGGFGGGGGAVESGPETTGLWLVLTLEGPGDAVERVTSAVFDRIGAAERAAGRSADAPLAELDELDGEYRDLATVWSVAPHTGSWGAGAAPAVTGDEDLDLLLRALHALHGAFEANRHALYRGVVGERGPRFVLPTAGLSLLGWRPVGAEDTELGSTVGGELIMDVITDPSRALVADTAQGSAGLAWAVASVVAERLLVGVEYLLLPHLGENEPARLPVDVLAVFDAARSLGAETLWLDAVDELAAVDASDDARARMAAQLDAGRALLVPARPVTLGAIITTGWWSVEPVTGAVRDQMASGRHQAGVEYGITTQPSRQTAPVLQRSLTRRIVCTLGRAVAVLDLIAALHGAPGAGQTARGLAEGVAAVREAAEKTRQAGKSVGGACNAASGPPL
jgi:hypothetical protein